MLTKIYIYVADRSSLWVYNLSVIIQSFRINNDTKIETPVYTFLYLYVILTLL